jgi:hypothetical protein
MIVFLIDADKLSCCEWIKEACSSPEQTGLRHLRCAWVRCSPWATSSNNCTAPG